MPENFDEKVDAPTRLSRDPAYFNPGAEYGSSFNPFTQGNLPGQEFSSGKGQFLDNLGNLWKTTVSGIDNTIKTNIEESLTNPVDDIRAAATGYLPPEVKTGTEEMGRVSRAYSAGVMPEVHYRAILDLKARQIKQRFPGYQDYVDSVMSSLTGSVPANALYNARLAAQRDEDPQAKFQRQYLKENEQYLGLLYPSPDGSPGAIDPDNLPEPFNEVRAKIAQVKAVDQKNTMIRSNLDTAGATSKWTQDSASVAANSDFNNQFSLALRSAYSPFGKTYQEFSKATAAAEAGGVDEDSATQLLGMVRQLRSQGHEMVEQTINTPHDEMGGKSYSIYMTPEARKQMHADLDTRMQFMEDAIVGKKWSLLDSVKSTLDYMGDRDALQAKLEMPLVRRLATLRDNRVLGNFSEIGLNIPEAYGGVTKETIKYLKAGILTGETKDIKDGLAADAKSLEGTPGVDTEIAKAEAIKSLIKDAQQGRLTDEGMKRLAQALYGPGNQGILARVNPSDLTSEQRKNHSGGLDKASARERYFLGLLDPTLTQNLAKADPQGWRENGIPWAENQSAILFQSEAREINAQVPYTGKGVLRFNTETHQLEWNPNDPSVGRFGIPASPNPYKDPMDKMNMTLTGLSNAYKADGMSDNEINERLANFLTNPTLMGIDLSAPRKKGILQRMGDDLTKILSTAGTGEGKTVFTNRGRSNLSSSNGSPQGSQLTPIEGLEQELSEANALLSRRPDDPDLLNYRNRIQLELGEARAQEIQGEVSRFSETPASGRMNAGLDDLQKAIDDLKEKSKEISEMQDKLARERAKLGKSGDLRIIPGGLGNLTGGTIKSKGRLKITE